MFGVNLHKKREWDNVWGAKECLLIDGWEMVVFWAQLVREHDVEEELR